jgi:uncharacterized damage-inducible protein DinB
VARGGIEELLGLLEEAFRSPGQESSSLLANLATVDVAAWRALPPGAARTIESITLHVGSCLVMYDDYAFGDGRLAWEDPAVQPWPEGSAPQPATIAWLEAAHDRLAGHVAALDDDARLAEPRPTNWGEPRPTRWIVAAMITHEAYHAGEINHLRSMLGRDDRWRHVQLEPG